MRQRGRRPAIDAGAAERRRRARGLHYLRSLSLSHVARFTEALAEVRLELAQNPQDSAALAEQATLERILAHEAASRQPSRTFQSALPRETMLLLERASHHYRWRGVPMLKNPFDFALYPMLLWDAKPRTIIEIGSASGGSALWFGDLMDTFGIEGGHIHSIDVAKVTAVSHPRVTFHEGNGRDPGTLLTEEFLAACPRPWLVIEDADHSYETSLHVLDFFHPRLMAGEYVVVEDGMSAAGPRQALTEFVPRHVGEYELDTRYCDFFGYNTTWCVNGYLRRSATKPQEAAAATPTANLP